MNHFFLKIAFGTIVFLALVSFIFSQKDATIIRVPKPQYASVVIADDRSDCEKLSEIRLSKEWENTCTFNGYDKNCALKQSEARQIFTNKENVVNQCKP